MGHGWQWLIANCFTLLPSITRGWRQNKKENAAGTDQVSLILSHNLPDFFSPLPIYIMLPIFHPAISWQIRCIFTSASLIGKSWKKIIANSKAALCWWTRPVLKLPEQTNTDCWTAKSFHMRKKKYCISPKKSLLVTGINIVATIFLVLIEFA